MAEHEAVPAHTIRLLEDQLSLVEKQLKRHEQQSGRFTSLEKERPQRLVHVQQALEDQRKARDAWAAWDTKILIDF